MRLTKAPRLLLLLLHIFPGLLHCPQCLSYFMERKATIPCSDSPLIDLEQGRDCSVNNAIALFHHRALQSCSGSSFP